MLQRYLVIYYDGNETKAKLIDAEDGKFPFGVEPEMVGDDCVDITAIVEVGSTLAVPSVVIDDQEVDLGEPAE